MATFRDFFYGANLGVWEEAIAAVLQGIEDEREAALNAVYLSTAIINELADRYGVMVGSKPDPSWQLEVFREHLQEVIQAYLMCSCTRKGVTQTVAATTQIPSILRPIQLLQRWLLGFQYLPNRFFYDLDGFVVASVDGPYEITDSNRLLILKVNGVSQSLLLPIGSEVSTTEVINSINSQVVGAWAWLFGNRFGIETLERDPGGSIQVEEPSTADTLFGFDNYLHSNSAPPPGGTGTQPFGWRLSGDYLAVNPEANPPAGTYSQPVSFDGSLFGVDAAQLQGAISSPYVGLLSPTLLTNGGFEQNFKEWDKVDGPEFFISSSKSHTGVKSLAVVTKARTVIHADGSRETVPVLNTIVTGKKFIPEGDSILVEAFNQAATPGEVYRSVAAPSSVFEWYVSNSALGYIDQQFSREPVIPDPDRPTVVLTDPSVDFITKGIKAGMAVHVVEGSYSFDGTIKGVATHQLLIDQWRNGPNGGPALAYIFSAAVAGSGVTYTPTSLQDPSKDFSTLVQVGGDYRTRDKVRIDETISQFGQVVSQRQIVRDIQALVTTTNPNDTIVPAGEWGSSPTPISATLSVSGSPYAVYVRPHNGTQYTVYHSLNEIPNAVPDFARISANFLYEVRFYAFDGSLVSTSRHQFRPVPGVEYEKVSFQVQVSKGAQTAQLAIIVGPDEKISEPILVIFDTPVSLTQPLRGNDLLVRNRDGAVLVKGGSILGDYEVSSLKEIIFRENGPNNLLRGDEIIASYDFDFRGGALVSVDDVVFRYAQDIHTQLHVASEEYQMQKVVFETELVPASGTITYTAIPTDGDRITLGADTYEFDIGSFDQGTVTYTGQPSDGNIITIGGNVFEFDNNGVVTPGRILVTIGGSDDATFQNLVTAINTYSSVVQATIDVGANVVTAKAIKIGVSSPAIVFTKTGVNFTLNPLTGTLTGGGVPSHLPGSLVVPITDLTTTYLSLVGAINSHSESVYADINTLTGVVTVRALELGFQGNDIVFTAVIAGGAFVLAPVSGHLDGATSLHGGARVLYTGQPNDGDIITVGGIVYEFDNDGNVTLGKSIPIGPNANATWSVLAAYVEADTVATTEFVLGRVDFTTVITGVAANAVPFVLSAANATALPNTGFFQGAVNSFFANLEAPTAAEVAAYLNSKLVGITASWYAPILTDPNNGYLILTSNTSGFKSAVIIGHGSANPVLGFANDSGGQNREGDAQPAWRIIIGNPGSQLVAVSRAIYPISDFFNTQWLARMWVASSNPAVKAQVILFFEDENGNMFPSISDTIGSGTISSVGVAVTGVGTAFTTQLQVGDLILASGQLRRVASIINNFNLTVDVAFLPVLAATPYTYQHPTTLSNPRNVVETFAADFGRFKNADVKLILNGVTNGDIIDIAFPFLTNDISKSLHVGDNTIPRNKQREHKLYRMVVANPDNLTDIEAGVVGANKRISQEQISLSNTDFTALNNQNVFPYSEVVERLGISAQGTIQYSGQPSDGDTLTLAVKVFEFDNNSIVVPGHVAVAIGATADDTFTNLVAAVVASSAHVSASLNTTKRTVTIAALLTGASGNSLIFAFDSSVLLLTPIFGTLDGGCDGEEYSRDVDYAMRYATGEIARVSSGGILDPSSSDLVITYSYFPGDIPLNENYSQTIKPVGVKLEIDQTYLYFFYGRTADFTNPFALTTNLDLVERTPNRFSYLRPKERGKYTQVVQFSASLPHQATLDFAGMVDQQGVLLKTKGGVSRAIPYDSVNGWFFVNDTVIELTAGTLYLAPGEAALFEADAEYEFVYFLKFQFTSAPIAIEDLTTGYYMLPYGYKVYSVDESKEDVDQILYVDTATRRANLNIPAVMDQALAEIRRKLGGTEEVISDEVWRFVDNGTVEIFLEAFDSSAIYQIVYKSSRVAFVSPVVEKFELSTSLDGVVYTPFAEFEFGDIRILDNYIKCRVTTYGDFDVDDYRFRSFSGIVDDATLNVGGFGLSPLGRFPFGDGVE